MAGQREWIQEIDSAFDDLFAKLKKPERGPRKPPQSSSTTTDLKSLLGGIAAPNRTSNKRPSSSSTSELAKFLGSKKTKTSKLKLKETNFVVRSTVETQPVNSSLGNGKDGGDGRAFLNKETSVPQHEKQPQTRRKSPRLRKSISLASEAEGQAADADERYSSNSPHPLPKQPPAKVTAKSKPKSQPQPKAKPQQSRARVKQPRAKAKQNSPAPSSEQPSESSKQPSESSTHQPASSSTVCPLTTKNQSQTTAKKQSQTTAKKQSQTTAKKQSQTTAKKQPQTTKKTPPHLDDMFEPTSLAQLQPSRHRRSPSKSPPSESDGRPQRKARARKLQPVSESESDPELSDESFQLSENEDVESSSYSSMDEEQIPARRAKKPTRVARVTKQQPGKSAKQQTAKPAKQAKKPTNKKGARKATQKPKKQAAPRVSNASQEKREAVWTTNQPKVPERPRLALPRVSRPNLKSMNPLERYQAAEALWKELGLDSDGDSVDGDNANNHADGKQLVNAFATEKEFASLGKTTGSASSSSVAPEVPEQIPTPATTNSSATVVDDPKEPSSGNGGFYALRGDGVDLNESGKPLRDVVNEASSSQAFYGNPLKWDAECLHKTEDELVPPPPEL